MNTTLEAARKQFPVLNKGIYANTATSGLLYEDLLEWRQHHDLDYLIGGAEMKMKSMGLLGETKKVLADFFSCDASLVALTPNFSIGWNFLLEGLQPNKNVLLLNQDYPSVDWPVINRDFKTFLVDYSVDVEERIIESIRNNSIEIFVLSLVHWQSGFYISPKFLKRLKTEYPNLLIVADGTQFCGMYEFDFSASGIDVLGVSGYKWLIAGFGNGFFLFSENAKAFFNLKSIGCASVNGDPSKKDAIRFTKYLEPGHLDSFNFGSLKFSIQWLSKLNMRVIDTHNRELSKKAKTIFSELNLLNSLTESRECHSTIFNVKLSVEQFEKVKAKNIFCAQRGEGVRFSFHFYNTLEDLDRLKKHLINIL